MKANGKQRILIATDGSPSAGEALAATARFPWPEGTSAHAILASGPWLQDVSETGRRLLNIAVQGATTDARRRLRRRWGDIQVGISDHTPVKAILAEAKRIAATTIVLGWRGHGRFQRLLAGSVSRTVATLASCPVLVVRKAPHAVRRFVVAYDGSENAKKAIEYLAALQPRRGSRVVVLTVTPPHVLPASVYRVPPKIRAELTQFVAEENQRQLRAAETAAAAAVDRLTGAGWPSTIDVRNGAPVATLCEALEEHRADAVIVGASTKSVIQRAVLGSVSAALLDRSPIPLLIVR